MAWKTAAQLAVEQAGGGGSGGAAAAPGGRSERRERRAARNAERAAANGQRRRDEWQCVEDGTRNFLDRTTCRECGRRYDPAKDSIFRGDGSVIEPTSGRAAGGDGSSSRRSRSRPAGASPKDRSPSAARREQQPDREQDQRKDGKPEKDDVLTLTRALTAAKEADLPENLLSEIRANLAAARRRRMSTRPIGAQIDSARASHARAQRAREEAEDEVVQAMNALAKAQEARDTAATDEAMAKEELDYLIRTSTELRTSTAEAAEQPALCLSRVISTLESAGIVPQPLQHPEAHQAWQEARQSLSNSPDRGRKHPCPKAAARKPQELSSGTDGETDIDDEDMEPEPHSQEEGLQTPIRKEQTEAQDAALESSLISMLGGDVPAPVRQSLVAALSAVQGRRRRVRMAEPVA